MRRLLTHYNRPHPCLCRACRVRWPRPDAGWREGGGRGESKQKKSSSQAMVRLVPAFRALSGEGFCNRTALRCGSILITLYFLCSRVLYKGPRLSLYCTFYFADIKGQAPQAHLISHKIITYTYRLKIFRADKGTPGHSVQPCPNRPRTTHCNGRYGSVFCIRALW